MLRLIGCQQRTADNLSTIVHVADHRAGSSKTPEVAHVAVFPDESARPKYAKIARIEADVGVAGNLSALIDAQGHRIWAAQGSQIFHYPVLPAISSRLVPAEHRKRIGNRIWCKAGHFRRIVYSCCQTDGSAVERAQVNHVPARPQNAVHGPATDTFVGGLSGLGFAGNQPAG